MIAKIYLKFQSIYLLWKAFRLQTTATHGIWMSALNELEEEVRKGKERNLNQDIGSMKKPNGGKTNGASI